MEVKVNSVIQQATHYYALQHSLNSFPQMVIHFNDFKKDVGSITV